MTSQTPPCTRSLLEDKELYSSDRRQKGNELAHRQCSIIFWINY